MNSLSWFIYLTQIADNLGGAAVAVIIFGGILALFGLILGPMIPDMMDIEPAPGTVKFIIRSYIVVMALAVVVSIFMPTRQTMLMIAGSEMGERLVKSDTANSIVNPGMDLIRKWIKQEADKIKDKT